MRMLLINLQVIVLLLIAVLFTALGGGAASMAARTLAGLPAFLSGFAAIAPAVADLLAGFAVFVFPLLFVSGLSLFFAVLAGWRPFRWCRVPGVLVNLAGIASCLFIVLAAEVDDYPPAAALAVYMGGNIFLFLRIPPQSDPRRAVREVVLSQLLLYLLPAGLFSGAFLFSQAAMELDSRDRVYCSLILLAYFLPFGYNLLAVGVVRRFPERRAVRKLAVSGAVALAAFTVFFPLGLPLVVGTLLLLELAELSLLYPAEVPRPGGVRDWIARVLGDRPAVPAAVVDADRAPAKGRRRGRK